MKMIRVINLLACLLLHHCGICNGNITADCKMGKPFVLKWNIENCPYASYGPMFFKLRVSRKIVKYS